MGQKGIGLRESETPKIIIQTQPTSLERGNRALITFSKVSRAQRTNWFACPFALVKSSVTSSISSKQTHSHPFGVKGRLPL